MRQEQPKKRSRKKVLAPSEPLTYEEKAYLKLLDEHPLSWTSIWCPDVERMIKTGLLEMTVNKMVKVTDKGKELYGRATKGAD